MTMPATPPSDQTAQPTKRAMVTERHLKLAEAVSWKVRGLAGPGVPYAIHNAAQLLADSEAEAVEQATKELRKSLFIEEQNRNQLAVLGFKLDAAERAKDELRAELDKEKTINRHACEDWADDDTKIKEFAKQFGIDTEGDSSGVPDMVMVVEQMADMLKGARAEVAGLRKELEEYTADHVRLHWLHQGGGPSADGWEYGVARLKFDENGKTIAAEWTFSDHRDVDEMMRLEMTGLPFPNAPDAALARKTGL